MMGGVRDQVVFPDDVYKIQSARAIFIVWDRAKIPMFYVLILVADEGLSHNYGAQNWDQL